MADDDIVKVLRAIEDGLVRHRFPFTWECADDARHIDPRTLQRALQSDLISVEANEDRASRPVSLTASGRSRLSREKD
jgi:hypothetical protein